MSASPSRLWQRLQSEGRLPIGELAVARGLLTGGRLAEALKEQKARPRPLGRVLLEKGWITADALGALLAEQESLCGPDARVPKAGRFLLLRELGRGGMGVVWEAWDPQIGRRIAVKSLAIDDEDARERIVREARAAGQIQHPGIVPVYEVAVHDGRPCIAMALIDGKAVSPGDRSIEARRAAEIVRDAARAVQAAHDKGIIHRDLVIDRAGRVFVLDFGLAVVERDASRTATGVIAGTPAYMAPEQALARRDLIGPRTDVYGLGATLYALLARHSPFAGFNDVEVLHAVPTVDPAPLPSVARDLDTIVRKAMEKVPSMRYESAGALADDLERFLRAEPILARPTSATWRFVRRHRKSISTTAIAGVVTVAILLLVIRARTAESGLDRRGKAGFVFEEGRRHYEDARLILYKRDAIMHHLSHAAAAAHDSLARAAAADPTYAEPLHYIGRTFLLRGMLPEADEAFTEAIRRQSEYAPAHLDRGWCRVMRVLMLEFAGKEQSMALRAQAEADFDRFVKLGGEPAQVALARIAIAWFKGEENAADRCAALQVDPRIADDAFLLEAVIRFAKGEWGRAAMAAAECVNRRWLDIPARQLLGLSLQKAGKVESAALTLRQLVEIYAEAPQGWALLGNALSALGRSEEAEQALRRSIELGPAFAAPRVVLGYLRLRQGRAADALKEFDGAIEQRSEGTDAHEGRGEALVALGRLDEALREYAAIGSAEGRARVLRAKGDREGALAALEGRQGCTARALRAQYRMELKRYDGVEEDLKAAITAEPWRDDTHLLMADLHYYLQRPDLGIGAVDDALARTPGAPRLLAARAERLRLLKRLEEARQDIEASIARDATMPMARRVHSRVLLDLRRLPEALAAAETAVGLDRSADSFFVRGLARLACRQEAEALRDFEESVRADPCHVDAWMNIAFEEARKGRLGEASTAYESVLRADPAHGEAALNLGICRTGMARYAEAAAALERATRLMAKDARPWKQLGTVYLSLGRKKEAGDAYERAITLDAALESELRPWINKARSE